MAKTKRNKSAYVVRVVSVVSEAEGRQALAEARRFVFARLAEKIAKEKASGVSCNLH